MSSKRLIIASNIKAIKEIINESQALFFESGNSYDLAQKIKISRQNNHLKKVKESYNLVKQYSWENRAERINNFLNQ